MTGTEFQLAQLNIARPKAPGDSALRADFAAFMEPISALAECSPGFVWRLQGDAGNATAIPAFGGDELIADLSVWRSVEELWRFLDESDRIAVTRRRREWFARVEQAMCLWWVPAGHEPSVAEAETRLTQLREDGPTPAAFTFEDRFPAPGARTPEVVIFDCDGVLVDSEPATCRVMAEVITEAGLPTTPEDCMREYVGQWWPDSEAKIAELLGRPLPADFEREYRRRQDEALGAGVEPVDGVIDVVDLVEASGLKACVASNGPHEKMAITLRGAGLDGRFHGRIFSSADVRAGKPAPDLFLHAAHEMGVDPAACLVVEDSPLGVIAARTAGMVVLGYQGHADAEALAAAGAVPFATMAELPGLLGLRSHPAQIS
ncbi:MAG: HAD-IA family hydrolase [Actinomycetota bacterium]|nr:HAD-IA family hydrolase [Actinomycetota bacterium]